MGDGLVIDLGAVALHQLPVLCQQAQRGVGVGHGSNLAGRFEQASHCWGTTGGANLHRQATPIGASEVLPA